MVIQTTIKVGDKVYYRPNHYVAVAHLTEEGEMTLKSHFENGIVKEIPEHTATAVRVVFRCNEQWEDYKEYTSALTDCADLFPGWLENNDFNHGRK